ncbi:MAG: hypothetical protein PSV23_13465 [Brevundimonas sp.]|uniref:hypothetical protein n=1 Tax=Brevundimonas sp. TaxID=1871086 RepID=UPI00248838F5|nr:hypothetical protein [Brevundimonas sp.]MDI1327793.1 hypothetical protein [Brevundimonas sp.]
MRTVVAIVAALLLTTGCDRPEAPPPADSGPLPPTSPSASAPASPPVLPGAASADASALVFMDAAGAPTATLSCGPDGLRIVVPGFRPIGSEDRLSIGTEGEAFALVADLAAPGPGVTASGAPESDLLDRLARGGVLFASYGQQTVGPLAAASPAGLQTLVSHCRRRE